MKNKKNVKPLENTKATESFVVTSEDGIIQRIGNGTIMQPRVRFSGKSTKWFDDSTLLKNQTQD